MPPPIDTYLDGVGEDRVWRTRGGKPPISVTHPDLAAELVEQALATALTAGSNRKVSWRCALGHPPWTATVNNRSNGRGCPYCAGQLAVPGETDLATTYPELAAELVDQSLATTLSAGSSRKVRWRCAQGHEWVAQVSSRARGNGCKFCGRRVVVAGHSDLATTHSELAAELVDQSLGAELLAGTERSVEWQCSECGHRWASTVASRTRSRASGCPACAGPKVVLGRSDLTTTHPDLAAELRDPTVGATVKAGSNESVWWRCANGHEFQSKVYHRALRHTGCPECAQGGFSSVGLGWAYLVATPGRSVLKYGVTNNLEHRLGRHARQGFTEVVETVLFDVGADALAVERAIKDRARAEGWKPAMTAASMPFGGASETLLADDFGDLSLRDFMP